MKDRFEKTVETEQDPESVYCYETCKISSCLELVMHAIMEM